MTSKTVGIVGGGAVGKAIAAYYKQVKIYDKYHPHEALEEVAAADYIFVAVPTPFTDGKPDLAEMDDALQTLGSNLKRPEEQVVIIKSTVVPGTTDAYQKKYPNINLLFSPEFLTERTAVEDFAKPDKQVVGYTQKTKNLAKEVLTFLPPAESSIVTAANAAELAKYAINTFYAFKVIFANQIYDICQKMEIDYELVREGLARDPRIVDSHFDVMHGGYRGFGGKCLPKDISTLVWFAKSRGFEAKFINQIINANEKLRSAK